MVCDDTGCDDTGCDVTGCDDTRTGCDDAECNDAECDDAGCDDAGCDKWPTSVWQVNHDVVKLTVDKKDQPKTINTADVNIRHVLNVTTVISFNSDWQIPVTVDSQTSLPSEHGKTGRAGLIG